ncbi:hypothetical protein [Frondihabitans cladoniiphilus]|uniref:Uncharacterized protein n=1 Tax=Frondihabitans cladoniiphilus TaxID=715785 RepID=A0ABP8W6C2_9MICO
MNAAVIATSSAATLAALVAITLFITGEIRRSRTAKKEARRQLVVRVLDVVDDVITLQLKPPLLRGFRSPDVDVALMLQRILLDLDKSELSISTWVWAQTQRLTLTETKHDYVLRASRMQGQLVSWHRGDIDVSWFDEDLAREPVIDKFSIPKTTAWKRAARNIPETTVLMAGIALAGLGLRRLLR